MAAAEFYMVYIVLKSGVSYEDLKKRMDLSLDWYRINTNLWILYTTSDVEKWYNRLSPLVKSSGRLLICKLNVKKRQGWMNKNFWNWLRELG